MSRYKRSATNNMNDEEDEMTKFMREAEMDENDEVEEYIPVKVRRKHMENEILHRKGRLNNINDNSNDDDTISNKMPLSAHPTSSLLSNKSLVDQAISIKKGQSHKSAEVIAIETQLKLEEAILKEANQVQTKALLSTKEVATGEKNEERLVTTWKAPQYLLEQTEDEITNQRKKWHIIVEGENCPPPIKSFKEMKIPRSILKLLYSKGIKKPTPIQIQGIPALFSGADMIGIAFTGSGKTLTFSLPMVMMAVEEEMNMPLEKQEGPLGVILAPSRELARQTFDTVQELCECLRRDGYPEIRSTLIIGGEDKRDQTAQFDSQGVHCIIATPGRLCDLLQKKKLNMDICKYFCLDEGDRMLDLGFDEEVQKIINHFKRKRQTILFSATMPQKFQDFARTTLVRPLLVNVGRAGAANLDVIQEVEFVRREARVVYLLECLQKTAPPVMVFCQQKGDVDEIYEYLLIKGVEAVSIHGGKDQQERNMAIELYKAGQKDVLVATDIAAKGLDFANIQHVINFDMPPEIENYVHRIGRTGRRGNTGVATTFINKEVDESVLLDLKHLLLEAKQRVPPILLSMGNPMDNMVVGGVRGCAICGGLGHRVTECPKVVKDARKLGSKKKDALGSGGGDW